MSIYSDLTPQAALEKWYQIRHTPTAQLSPEERADVTASPTDWVSLQQQNPGAWRLMASGTQATKNPSGSGPDQRKIFNPNTGTWDTQDVHGLWSHPETWIQLAAGGALGGVAAAPLFAGGAATGGGATAGGGAAATGGGAAATAGGATAGGTAATTAGTLGVGGTLGKLALQGGGALLKPYLGKKATAAAAERSPEEQAAITGAQNAAGTLTNTGQSLVGAGRTNLNQAAGYFRTLLSGNRAAMANATAAPRAQLQEGIRGAQTQLTQSGVRGAAKEQLSGNLARQGQSQVAGLTTGVQPWAAGQLAGVGNNYLQSGSPMLGQAGNVYTNLLKEGFDNRKYARKEGETTGNVLGGFVADLGNVFFNPKKAPGTYDPTKDPNFPG